MSYIQSKLIAFTTGIILTVSSTPTIAFGESVDNQKTNYQKPLKAERNIIYAKAMVRTFL